MQAIRIGLALVAFSIVSALSSSLMSIWFGSGVAVALALGGAILGLLGLVFLVASVFLPRGRTERPTFTEELLSREKLQYGVFTDGNWMSVLDRKAEEEKKRHKK